MSQQLPQKGERWNWKHDPDTKLVYVGTTLSYMGWRNTYWHQFEKVDDPGKVWCEVLTSDLHLLEKTK